MEAGGLPRLEDICSVMVGKKVRQCGHRLITELWYASVFTSTTASFLCKSY